MKVIGIQCNKCQTTIVSLHRHDFKRCSCKAVAIDDGRDYTRILGNPEDYTQVEVDLGEEEHRRYVAWKRQTDVQRDADYRQFYGMKEVSGEFNPFIRNTVDKSGQLV